MITRGYLIGEIVDGLSTISQQVSTRCRLGLTDLNKYLEDFFKDYLNEALSLSLFNLNDLRSNEPGLDLGDDINSIGFQITSTKTSDKINKTLKCVSERENKYNTNIVLIIGSKQTSYSLNEELLDEVDFSESDIWDIDELCRKTVTLSLDRLQKLYDLIRRDLAKVKIELEIPDEDGNYATSISDYVEEIQKPLFSDFKKYQKYQRDVEDSYEYSRKEIKRHFKDLSRKLSQLPRITREFYAFLLERRDSDDAQTPSGSVHSELMWFNHNRLIRICRFPGLKGELTLLEEHGFVDIEPPQELNGSPFVRIFIPIGIDGFIYEFIDYVEAQSIGYRKPLVSLDFSEF